MRSPMHDTPDQVHWHEPKAGENAGLGKFKRAPMPYDRFMEAEGVPVYRGIGVRRVQDLPLVSWPRLGGRGTTEVWQEGQTRRHVFEWQAGSLFTIPLNACHRIVNAASSPALLLCGTTAPNVMNLFDNPQFVFNCPFAFNERF